MNIIINEKQHEVENNCNLIDILDKIQIANRFGIANFDSL